MDNTLPKKLLINANLALKQCYQNFAEGADLNLGEFEQIVKDLCVAVQKLPPNEAIKYKEGLQDMSKALYTLSEALAEHRDKLKTQLQGLGDNVRAFAAYSKNQNFD